MKTSRKCNSKINPKTGKPYSVKFKKEVVETYLSGMYDSEKIKRKYKISINLLYQWTGWYYHHFQSAYYSKTNYGKGKIPTGRKSTTESRKCSTQANTQGGADAPQWNRDSAGDGGGRSKVESKKKWSKAVEELKKQYPNSSMEELCQAFGKSRQAWYKQQKKQDKEEYYADLIEEEVLRIRKYLPRMGGRKLYYMMHSFLKKNKIKKGRDKFFEVLKERNLLIKKKKNRKRTTNSNHSFRKHDNLIKDLQVDAANQLWVSDITYISCGRTFFYLSLVMDAYSRKIVGWHLSEDLKAEGTIQALKMALTSLSPVQKRQTDLIHHSDRGVQYCCYDYIKLLNSKHISVSMTQNGDPYENILAERINRTIKEEFLSQFLFSNFQEAKQVTAQSIKTYNQLRPHLSLDYLTPEQAHQKSGELKKWWKNPEYKKAA
jgi:transposase InsO family protein/transposase-like protein